ncbi:hypothetical protein IWQ61_003260 [Dispira simplex]|nr:hypothetical protein IWQ61_003260 [Dispira simplex]
MDWPNATFTPSPPKLQLTEPSLSLRCFQTLFHKEHSVLSLAATKDYIFCGTQGSCIHVWGAQDFLPRRVLTGHRGSIFALVLDATQKTLYSGAGDGTVRAWDTETLTCRFVVHSGPNVGDILSLAYCADLDTLFMGCQNTSIQWFSPSSPDAVPKTLQELEAISYNSKFFDSAISQTFALEHDPSVEHYMVYDSNIQPHSHFGHVYTLLLGTLPNVDATVLFSGSGDGQVKLWLVGKNGLSPFRTMEGDITNVFSMALNEGLLFCGCQDGLIRIWDLETYQMILHLQAHTDDVLALVTQHYNLLSASADGTIKVWDRNSQCLLETQAHDGIILTMTMAGGYLVSGGSDQAAKFWQLNGDTLLVPPSPQVPLPRHALLTTLEKWISYPSISGSPQHQHDCRRAARYLKNTLEHLGAESCLLPTSYGHNPLVFARFTASTATGEQSSNGLSRLGAQLSALHLQHYDQPPPAESQSDAKHSSELNSTQHVPTVLVYGHYDVFSVAEDQWDSPPFTMQGRDGFLYGRGVTDNKGPVLAAIFAVYELLQQRNLSVNVEFIVEGEEENGSAGLEEALTKARDLFTRPDVILLSNSYWIGEDLPCLTYGLRGSIHASIQVTCDRQDVHSGVSGGAVDEPLQIIMKILARLVGENGEITIPDFYRDVAPVTDHEDAYYSEIVQQLDPTQPLSENDIQDRKDKLMSRWRYPTLTVHKLDVSGPQSQESIIPRCAQAAISMRVVPNQVIETIVDQFTSHVKNLFDALDTSSRLEVSIRNSASWWLGDTNNQYFKAAERAITHHWNVKPVYIREGGSIGAVPWLERFFQSTAVNIPLGQSSDQAHLSNERIRLKNLTIGKQVIQEFFKNIGQICSAETSADSPKP